MVCNRKMGQPMKFVALLLAVEVRGCIRIRPNPVF